MDNDKFQELILQQFNKVFDKLNSMETRIASVERGQLRLESRMENEVIDKLGALFDARVLQNDKNDQILEKLSDMDEKLDYALLKITQHEVKLMTKKKLSPR